MKAAVRMSTFETNSSSLHAIVIDKTVNVANHRKQVGKVELDDYYASSDMIDTPMGKLSYLWSIVSAMEVDDGLWEDRLRYVLDLEDDLVTFSRDYGGAVSGVNRKFFLRMHDDPKMLRQFIYSPKSYVAIGSDYSDDSIPKVLSDLSDERAEFFGDFGKDEDNEWDDDFVHEDDERIVYEGGNA